MHRFDSCTRPTPDSQPVARAHARARCHSQPVLVRAQRVCACAYFRTTACRAMSQPRKCLPKSVVVAAPCARKCVLRSKLGAAFRPPHLFRFQYADPKRGPPSGPPIGSHILFPVARQPPSRLADVHTGWNSVSIQFTRRPAESPMTHRRFAAAPAVCPVRAQVCARVRFPPCCVLHACLFEVPRDAPIATANAL